MKIDIFDTTLRDGMQGRGINYTIEDKLKILKALDEIGVSYIEGGIPGANEKEREFFKKAKKIPLKNSTLVAFGSTRKANIKIENDEGIKALLDSGVDTVAIVGKSSKFQIEEVLKTSLEENLKMIYDSIFYLKSRGRTVIYDSEHFFDSYKEDKVYAMKTLHTAKEAGAKVITLCDTNGAAYPGEIYDVCSEVKKNIDINLGIHTHNDIGCGDGNTLMAVESGINFIQGTFIGFGERCGNCNLSTIIPTLQLKKGYDCIDSKNMKNLTYTANLIAEISNVILSHDKPYVGSNAFTHKGGMHVDGVNKNTKTFEHISPSEVGNTRNIVFSDIAGRSALLDLISGIDPSLNKDSKEIKSLVTLLKEKEGEGYQYEIASASLKLLVAKYLNKFNNFFEIELFRVIGEHNKKVTLSEASAIVKIKVGGEYEITADEGNGPVNALDNALRKALVIFYPQLKNMKLIDYKVRVVDQSGKTGARVRVVIESMDENESWSTIGVSEDVINASFLALIDSIEYKLFKDPLL